jgi:hypothetical protein
MRGFFFGSAGFSGRTPACRGNPDAMPPGRHPQSIERIKLTKVNKVLLQGFFQAVP